MSEVPLTATRLQTYRWVESSRPVWCLLGLLFVLANCGPSAQFQRGDQAAQAGDWYTAVSSFRAALADDPDDAEIQQRLIQAEESLVVSSTSAVSTYVGFHDFTAALQTIAPALELLPLDPRLQASLESIRVGGVAYYRDLVHQGHYRAAVDGVTQLGASFPHDRDVAGVIEEARQSYAEELRMRAVQAETDNRLGSAIACWTALWSLNGSENALSRIASLRVAVEEEIRFAYNVRLEGDWPINATAEIQDGLAEIVLDPDDAVIALSAFLSRPDFNESYRSRIASQLFLAGYQDVPNPAHQNALRDVTNQEQQVLRAERDVLSEESDVHDAEVRRDEHLGESDYQSYYDSWDSEMRQLQAARERLLSERQRLQDYRERLRRTPPTLEQEVWEEHRYEVQDWQLEGVAEFSAQIFNGDVLVHERANPILAVTTDQVHDAQPILGLAANPLIYPLEPVDLAVSIHDQALTTLDLLLEEQFQTYRSGFESGGFSLTATAPDDAAEHLVRYVLLQPSSVSPETAAWLNERFGLTDPGLMATLQP